MTATPTTPNPNRDSAGWGEDPEPKHIWEGGRGRHPPLDVWQKKQYIKLIGPYEKRLGYNQHYTGSVEREWEFRNKYPWGEP